MSDEQTQGDMEAVILAARETSKPHRIESVDTPHFVIVPDGSSLTEIDVGEYRDTPSRKTGVYKPATVASFAAYVKAHDAVEPTTIWVHPTSGRVVSVIDDNAPGEPGWGQHRADLLLAHTPEWLYWTAKDGKAMGQESFAEHIESGSGEIVEPDAATVLEIAQTFHAKKNVSYRSSTRLSSGQVQFLYDEEIKATAGTKGELTIPTSILLEVAPFVGEAERQVVARLRHRITEGTLILSYHLERPHVVIRDALDSVQEALAKEFPNVYVGEPAPLR